MNNTPFYAKVIDEIDNGTSEDGRRFWNYLKVGIFQKEEGNPDRQIGEYIRNYHTFSHTFHPFKQGDQWYALYSKDYTATRIMSLPDCKDLGGEERSGLGFCPVDFYVPWDNEDLLEEYEDELSYKDGKITWPPGSFGFVSGCVWGDDNGMKLQFLDLRDIKNGNFIRTERFGRTNIGSKRIKDCVDFGGVMYSVENDDLAFEIWSLSDTLRLKGNEGENSND